MKTLKAFLIVMCLSPAFIFAQVPYTQWVEFGDSIPEGINNSYENMKLHTPDKNEVELPAYPGAEILETSQSTQSVDESQNPLLPTITLISSDPAEKVIKVYKEMIQDYPEWHWADNLKIFYKGNLRDALNGYAPYVQIRSVTSDEPDLIYISPDILEVVNSKIIVSYDPNRLR